MTMTIRSLSPFLLMGAGLALAAAGQSALSSHEALRHSRNPFAVQGSAYGKLLARLAETTIDRVWHLGVEQIVPHYMSGENHHHGHREEEAAAGSPAPREESLLKAGKHWIQDRVVAQHTRTNEKSMSEAHLATVYRDIEGMLLRSFKFDPTHYGAYDSYHLFLTISEFGGTPVANEQAKRVALAAIGAARKETEDPEPWLTAAAAGMNLFLMDSAPYTIKNEPIPLEMLRKYRNEIGHCLQRFTEIQAESERLGIWQNLSMERQMEIAERARFGKSTFAQFDALIARAEQRLAPGAPEAEVAGSTEP